MGDKVEIDIENEKVVIRKIKPSFAEHPDFLPVSFDQVLEKTRNDATQRLKKLGVVL